MRRMATPAGRLHDLARRETIRRRLVLAAGLVLCAASCAIILARGGPYSVVGVVAILLLCGTAYLMGSPPSASTDELAATVGTAHEAADLPSLVSLLGPGCDGEPRDTVLSRIARLLPLFDGEQSPVAPADLRKLMGEIAKPPRYLHTDFCIALLDYASRASYTPALGAARRLSGKDWHPAIRSAARRCRARLEATEREMARRGTLVMPADEPTAETLLRAAVPVAEEQLLRPAEGKGP